MALTQTDIDNLESALASGELEVEQEGRRVRYRSIDELTSALAYAREQIAQASTAGSVTQSLAQWDRD